MRSASRLTPFRHGRSALSRRSDCESALGEISISDDAGECGNHLIGTACSAHLRNSRTNRMHGLPQIGDDNRIVVAIGYMPHTKSLRDASDAADKHDRLRPSDPLCEAYRLPPGD